ncbi:Uncharacterised protein [uncultured Clostridium sp.]|nr:Uncharacterised protein [uncultured Clostridium sp.]SCJ52448.1 Uncharacterised protein [uncultured Clostridium sp.]
MPEQKMVRIDKKVRKRVGDLYKDGLTSKQISCIVKASDDAIRKCISRHFIEYKSEHEENKKLIKESNLLIEKTYKRFISDQALLKQNRQSFIYDEKFNLIFDSSRGEIPNGLPAKYMSTT